jgi:hypothetical protein
LNFRLTPKSERGLWHFNDKASKSRNGSTAGFPARVRPNGGGGSRISAAAVNRQPAASNSRRVIQKLMKSNQRRIRRAIRSFSEPPASSPRTLQHSLIAAQESLWQWLQPRVGLALAQYLLDVANREYGQKTSDSSVAFEARALVFK